MFQVLGELDLRHLTPLLALIFIIGVASPHENKSERVLDHNLDRNWRYISIEHVLEIIIKALNDDPIALLAN